MTRPLLQYGSKGTHVVELQELLNKWILRKDGHHNNYYCKPDGDFGPNTKDIVQMYQRAIFLHKDGKVGSMTWSALLGTEMYNCFDLPTTFVDAPTIKQCWAGATAMQLKQNSANTTKPAGVLFETLPGGALGGLGNSHANMQKFANAHNMQMFKAEPLTCPQLVNLLDQFGRLMLNIKGIDSQMKSGNPDDSHVVNLVGARGNGQSTGTTITIYNPSGGFAGQRVIMDSYSYFKSKYPKMTYQVFYQYSNKSNPLN